MDHNTPEGIFRRAAWENYFNELYPFQKEVVSRVGDTNSLVVLPTGSGKTVIAAALAARKLAVKPDAKIIFLVNRVPLVRQQAEVMRTVQGTNVACVSGENKDCASWQDFYHHFNVLVIIDSLFLQWTMRSDDRAMWDCIGLIIFDEVHHARGNSHYLNLIKAFHVERRHSFQQIIGLSASPVLISFPSEAASALHQLEAATQAKLVTVANEVDDLITKIPKPAMHHVAYSQTTTEALAMDTLGNCFDVVESLVRRDISQWYRGSDRFPVQSLLSALRQEKGSFLLGKSLKEISPTLTDYPLALIAVHLLSAINSALVLLDDGAVLAAFQILSSWEMTTTPLIYRHCVPASASHDPSSAARTSVANLSAADIGSITTSASQHQPNPYLEGIQVNLLKTFDILQNIANLQAVEKVTSTKMKTLLSILEENIGELGSEEEESFRGIVFCRTKQTAHQVTQELQRLPVTKRLNPSYFVGHNSSSLEDGSRLKMSDKEQQQRLHDFMVGGTKLLIATSVAEEGLDIPLCNVVIRYDSDFTALSFTQSRGRARKANSTFYVITREGEHESHIQRILGCINASSSAVLEIQRRRDLEAQSRTTAMTF